MHDIDENTPTLTWEHDGKDTYDADEITNDEKLPLSVWAHEYGKLIYVYDEVSETFWVSTIVDMSGAKNE